MMLNRRPDLKVGDTVYVADMIRNYTMNPEAGFQARQIIGETSRSWIIEPEWAKDKKPKTRDDSPQLWTYWTHQEKDDLVWVNQNRPAIAKLIRNCNDRSTRGYLPSISQEASHEEREQGFFIGKFDG